MKENTMNKPKEAQKAQKAQKENANLSWLNLEEEELLKVSEVSVCMYKGQTKSVN